MIQTRKTRIAAALTVMIGSLGTVATLATAATAATGASILSQSSYVDSIGYRHIVGEVQNTGTTNIEYTKLNFNFYDGSGRLLGTDFTYTAASRLAPGERSPFEDLFEPPAGYDHYTATVTTSSTSARPNHNFTATVTNEFTDSIDYRHIVGTIRNNNTTSADYVEAIFTFYDANGTVVNSDYTYVNTDSSSAVAAGQEATFEELVDQDPAFATYRILVESPTAPSVSTTAPPPSTPASASPSPTAVATVSPSPGADATASPSASAAASPTSTSTAQPSPSATADAPPQITVSPSTINAGQRVTVAYYGQPYETLDVYSKTQPATGYSRIRQVVLDASGYGTTSHAPNKNTRIMAKTAGGATSAQPLIQVRSVASLNVRRAATRSFTFSGTVSPALNNRLVSIYRNGVLVAQGRTNASGVYVITKTLAAGTFNFQAKTPNDTYNLGAASPVRIVRIY